MLDPQARVLIDTMRTRAIPTVDTLTPAEARALYRAGSGASQPEPPAVHLVQDHAISSGDARILLREYQPAGRAADAILPALLYLHGGGWSIGDLETHDVLCRSLANQAHCVVLAVDYRLAPEHPFPAAYDDALAAFAWALENAAGLLLDPTRLAIGGDSAGGNLAAAACLGLRETAQAPLFQLLIYPATDMHGVAPSHTTNGSGYLLTNASIGWYLGNYLNHERDRLDWRASPLLAASHAGLPPALVLTAGFDPLRDEGLQYADALSAAGVASQYVCFERQIHGFVPMGRILREANTAVGLCALALRQAFAR